MKRYISLWLVCLLAVFSLTARAQEGTGTKAQPNFPALPFTLTFAAPAEGSASSSISADDKTLTAPTTLYSGTKVTITTVPAAGYRMVFGYPKAYRTGTPATTIEVTPVTGSDNTYTFTMPDYPATVEAKYEKIPYAVSFAAPANGSLALDTAGTSLTSGTELVPGTTVTLTTTPATGYRLAFGYPKAYRTDASATMVVVTPVAGRDNAYSFTVPEYPVTVEAVYEKIPYAVTFSAPANGTLALDTAGTSLTSGTKLISGTEVTLKVAPATGYRVVFGSLKVYCTNEAAKNLQLDPVSGESGEYTFTMPGEPVTVDVEFEAKPAQLSSDTRLRSLQYKVGTDNSGTFIPVPDFTAARKEYTVTLPSATADNAQITLSGTPADVGATLPSDAVTVTLSDGSGTATLTVTAEDRSTTETYKVKFQKAEAQKYIVTIETVVGGTITVTDATGKVINSGDVVADGAELTLTNTAVPGYSILKYTVKTTVNNTSDYTDVTNPVRFTVASDVTISAGFTPPTDPIQPENIGTPAVPKEKEEETSPTDAPVVIIPDAGSLPSDTELSQLRLVKDDVPESKENDVKSKAEAAASQANIDIDANNMILMEVTLVKVTTIFDNSSGKSETTVTPVQPTDKVKVRIPYPENVDKSKHDFTIIHLKSDGSTDVYSTAKGNLTLADDYMEITVTGFSPFAVAYVAKSSPDPGPGPDPDPVYYTVTLPAVEGAMTDPAPGNYEVESWDHFRFYLTLDKDYDQSVPVVTIRRGETVGRDETITPRISDGAYIIDYVRAPVTISIAGIQKNTDVANATITTGLKIRTEPSALCLEIDRPEEVRILTLGGATLATFKAQPGLNRRSLAPGLYIVQTARMVCKVIVR